MMLLISWCVLFVSKPLTLPMAEIVLDSKTSVNFRFGMNTNKEDY